MISHMAYIWDINLPHMGISIVTCIEILESNEELRTLA